MKKFQLHELTRDDLYEIDNQKKNEVLEYISEGSDDFYSPKKNELSGYAI